MTAHPGDPVVLPAGLRERVLAASWQARAAGRAIPEAAEISPAEAFRRAVAALDRLLGSLDADRWQVPVLRDLDVQGLIGHLTGVEEDVQRGLSGDPGVAGVDHVASTQPVAVRQAGRPVALTHAEWRRAADRTLSQVAAVSDLEAPVAVHSMWLPLSALLVARAFEIWTHDNDIRRAAGLPATAPDASTLRLMTDLAARLLPYGAALTGLHQPIDVHLVLTGPGGGTWDVTVGADQGEDLADRVPVRIVTDAVAFCQLVASRVSPADLDLDIAGDPSRAAEVLAAAAALALD
jgi:uncharacterized protein (TIGR03083 family)